MGCFRINLASPLELIFYGLSLLQAYRAVQLTGLIRQDWSGFLQPPLTRQKMRWVEQAAFFLAIPPSVIVHEFFHAIPIWQFGGHIVNCGYGFYWGFVQPDRVFPAVQQWIISLGGTIGSLLFALVLFAFLYRNRSQTLRYFARQSLRSLLFYSLIYYPVFTAVTFIGDWRIIYDFSATPLLSGGTAVIHILILLLFWQANRRGWFEMVGHRSLADAEAFARLEAEWQHNPQDSKLLLAYAEQLRIGGARQKATAVLKQALRLNPHLANAYLQFALIQAEGKKNVPITAVRNLEKALQLGLSQPREKALAHQLLGQYKLDTGKGEDALQQLNQAIDAAETRLDAPINPLYKAHLYHLRSLAHQRLRQPALAQQDAQQALELAQTVPDARTAEQYKRELELIENLPNRR